MKHLKLYGNLLWIKMVRRKENLTFENLVATVESLNLEDAFSMDDLYEEYTCVCPHLQTNSTSTEVDDDLNTDVIWSTIFMKAGPEKLPNLLKVVAFVISIPCSNAAVERVFSMMGWV
ncbi:zinc finger 862-like [Pelobates cultripes]|uniref:Zinc finger 862-like n=1 Tax=Pelobates cultripes TaxID=61616 RepID=A0AAD1WDU5_PELCU|nr:zinc finger 862-like [Pelobates cultripes]